MSAGPGALLRKLANAIQRRSAHNALILVYHRLAEVRCDPFSLCVAPQRFAEHLDVLRRTARPIPLGRFPRALRGGIALRRAVAVTFDDGYADNLACAKPLLEQFDVPATMFIASGQLNEVREFWWDELERIFLEPGTLPAILRLVVNGSSREWTIGDAIVYDESACLRHRTWRAWEVPPTSRHALYLHLWRLLRPLHQSERRRLLDEISNWANCGVEGRDSYRTLSVAGLLALGSGGLIEIGAHSVSHAALCDHPVRIQRAEIRQSRARLEEILGREVASFAYPYGAHSDETVDIVRDCGFACACTTEPDRVVRGADQFQLPRLQVEDWDGEEFARRLKAWFDGGEEGYRQ